MSTVNPGTPPIRFFQALRRGLTRTCPRCGQDGIFEAGYRYRLKTACSHCGCAFMAREPDTYFFMYMSTGLITALFLIAMFFFTPKNQRLGQAGVALLAVVLMFGTLPFRKGMAIAFDIYVEEKFGRN